MARLRMQFLGGFDARLGKRALNSKFESDKVRALLAYLAVEAGIAHRRENLAFLLWPDFAERAARTNLRRALANLRRVTGDHETTPSFLHISRQEIQFNTSSPYTLDVKDFLLGVDSTIGEGIRVGELSQTVQIYQGLFLQGFSISDSDPFEEWLTRWRRRLRNEALRASMHLSLLYREKGNYEEALSYSQRATEIDPLHEPAHQEIIWLLAALGRQPEAQRQYRALKQLLRQELDVAPRERTRELIKEIESGAMPEAPQTTLVVRREPREVGPSPYRGLAAFQEEDAKFFFGRSKFVTKVSQGLTEKNLVCVVIGPSGSGKSSAVHAGITPKLREEGWQVVVARPKNKPYIELCRAVLAWTRPKLPPREINQLANQYGQETRTGKTSLSAFLTAQVEGRSKDARLIIILDQFEELFTLNPDESTVREYIHQILETAKPVPEGRRKRIKFLITIRADFMAQVLEHRDFADALESSSFLLGPMNREELREAITSPAELQGAAFEPGLVERILDDVGVSPGNLPLLEFALTQLWDRMDEGWMTHEAYEKTGAIQGAIANYAEDLFLGLSSKGQEAAKRVLVQLVHPGDGTEDTRRVATRTELGGENWKMVQHLADKRLVVTSASEVLTEQAEVVHEALIWGWARLRSWMEEERTFRIWQERLRVSIDEWKESKKETSALLQGSRLAEAEDQLATSREFLSNEEAAYIEQSIQNREFELAQAESRRKRILAGLVTGLLVTLALAFFATEQWQRAETETDLAISRELARAAQANLEIDPELSLLLGLESISISKNSGTSVLPESMELLHSGIRAMRTEMVIHNEGRVFETVSFNPTGSRIFAWDNSSFPGSVMVWDASNGELLSELSGIRATRDWTVENRMATVKPVASGIEITYWDINTDEPESTRIQELSSAPIDGTLNADWSMNGVSLQNGTIQVWSVENEEVIITLGEVTFQASPAYSYLLAFSHDGNLLASVNPETGQLGLWDLSTGELIRSWIGHTGSVNMVEFSPDDSILISASSDASAKVWDVVSGELLVTLSGHMNELTDIAISQDGERLATAAWDRKIVVWDLQRSIEHGTQEQIMILSGHASAVMSVDFDPSGNRLVSSGRDGTIRFWDISLRGNTEGQVIGISGEIPPEYPAVIRLSDNGELLAAGNYGTSPKVWNIYTGELMQSFPDHEEIVIFLDLSEDGRLLATTSLDETLRVWDVENATMLTEMPDLGCRECNLAFGPGGNSIIVVGDYEGSSVDVYDLTSDDTGNDPSYQLVLRLSVPGNGDWIYGGVVFSPDGNLIATAGSGNVVNIWDAVSGELVSELVGHTATVYGISFNPAGDRIATGGQDGTARIWIPGTGELLHTLTGHNASVFESSFSPDGTLLATASFDGTAKLWDVETGELAYSLFGHSSGITSVVFSPDGRYLYTAGLDGEARTHTLDLDELISLAESRVFRDFTEEECRVYLHLESCSQSRENR